MKNRRKRNRKKKEQKNRVKGKNRKKEKQETEEVKEAQKGLEEKGKHTYSLRYRHYRSGRFRVEGTQPD